MDYETVQFPFWDIVLWKNRIQSALSEKINVPNQILQGFNVNSFTFIID